MLPGRDAWRAPRFASPKAPDSPYSPRDFLKPAGRVTLNQVRNLGPFSQCRLGVRLSVLRGR